nr:beta transducin-like protein HET-E2c [Colletotrichum truncatum]KAF6797950.1 beta transducin-like protein HET-E2c [Colletotrichum truncatum]
MRERVLLILLQGQPKADADANARFLADLRTTDPRDDKSRIERTKGGLLRDSYIWVLNNNAFQKWRDSEDDRLVWIKGDAGKGKTMLLCGIIDELQKSIPSATLLSFAFCQATDVRLNSAMAVLRSLLYLLLVQNPKIIGNVREQYDHAGQSLFNDVNSWDALYRMLMNILQSLGSQNTYLVIDALDECETDLERLVDLVVHITSSCNAKLVVSSRNWLNIEEMLSIAPQQIPLCLELNQNSISAAVSTYISYKVDQLNRLKKYDNETRNAVQQHLETNSNDTFLWVALVCQQLADPRVRKWHTREKLKLFPPKLYPLYKRMMDQVLNPDNQPTDANLCRQVLGIMSITYRPLSLEELISLVEMPHNLSTNLDFLQEIVQLCGSFLTLRERTVSFVHQSAKDFLLEKERHNILPSGFAEHHHAVATSGYAIEDVETPHPDPLAPTRYACIYWVNHLIVSYVNMVTLLPAHTEDGDKLHSFLTKHYLHWLEAMSLLRSVPEGIGSLFDLLSLVQAKEDMSELIPLVWDAWRFVKAHKLGIEKSPLQVYSSALILSPAKSVMRQLYHQEELAMMNKPSMKDHWDLCLQTLEGHQYHVNSIAIFGTLLASVSDDGTMKLWNIVSGQCLRTIERRVSNYESDVVSDGRQLWASCDDTIEVWDVTSGQYIMTLNGHSDVVTSLALLGEQLASGSSDKTVKIWNAASGQHLMTLQGHTDDVTSLAFVGSQLASGSSDKTIKLWDAVSGEHIMTIEGHSTGIMSIALSRTQLASASTKTTIEIWDAVSGQHITSLKGHKRTVNALAFLENLLASGSYDSTIKVWNTISGQCLQTLEGHRMTVSSVAFVGDGIQIASASYDGTIKLWDVSSEHNYRKLKRHGKDMESSEIQDMQQSTSHEKVTKRWGLSLDQCCNNFEGHGDWINQLSFSRDGTYLASQSNHTIKIWDVASGRCLKTLEEYRIWMDPLEFSDDNIYLASISDNAVKIWDLAFGQHLHMLQGHSDGINSVTFLSDCTRLASGSYDRTIKIWDLVSGQCLQTLQGHVDSVSSVTFLSDSTRLASGSKDCTIKIWGLSSGHCLQTLVGHGGNILSVCYIGDSGMLASLSQDQTIRIWDTVTGKCLTKFDTGSAIRQLFYFKSSNALQTELGIINLDGLLSNNSEASSDAANKSSFQGYGIAATWDWIIKDSKNFLWLPTEYRPSELVVMGSTVAIGCVSGRVLIFRF